MPEPHLARMTRARWPVPAERPDLQVSDDAYQLVLPILRSGPGRIPTNKGRRLPPEIYTPVEIYRLFVACRPNDFGTRTMALMTVMYRAGLRINEALNLRRSDLHPDESTIRVRVGKGGHSRTAAIDRTGMQAVLSWAARHRSLGFGPETALFCTLVESKGVRPGRQLSSSQIRGQLPTLAKNARVHKRLHSHGFRHTFAYELSMEGFPITVIRQALGHVWLSSTVEYLDHLAPYEMIERVRERQWKLPIEDLLDPIPWV